MSNDHPPGVAAGGAWLKGTIVLTKETAEAEPGPAEPAGGEGESITCAHCGALVEADQRSCPQCGHAVYRTCFCGWRIPATQAVCPNCGADWSQSMRVARKSRSRTPRRKRMLRHAAIGAGAALLLAFIAYALITALAATATDSNLPQSILDRVALAGQGLGRIAAGTWAAIARHAGTVASVLAIAALGAAVGVGLYIFKLSSRGHRSRHSTRRMVRKRRR